MVLERTLVGGAVAVVAVTLVAALVAPGVLADIDEPVRPGRVNIEEVIIAPGEASGETATLEVGTRLAHRGGSSSNVTVEFRAVDADSGMLETSRTVSIDTIEDDREVSATTNLTVERDGGYRIETIVYQDERRVDEAARVVRGVGSLQPAYARTTVAFHRFDEGLPEIEYSIAGVRNNRTTLRISTYLTNAGDQPAGGLRLTLKARQADSNIVADETDITVGQIAPGQTAQPTTQLTVPDGYNYYLDAILWKDGVIVGTARSVANLDPTETLSVNETRRQIGLEVTDFERTPVPRRTVMAERTPTPGQPGFTAAVAIAALLVAGALFGRRIR